MSAVRPTAIPSAQSSQSERFSSRFQRRIERHQRIVTAQKTWVCDMAGSSVM